MKILLLAPQPFYQERGTPIAVDLLLRVLEKEHDIDAVVYEEGEDVNYDNVRIYRAKTYPTMKGISPGFSVKKMYANIGFFLQTLRLLCQNRYDVVHAVEESVFFAYFLRLFFSYRLIQDVDSCMTTQIVDKLSFLKPAQKLLHWVESLPMRKADAVVCVCDSLAGKVRQYRQQNVYVIKDIDLSDNQQNQQTALSGTESLAAHFAHPDRVLFLYIGNLQGYQGIDLLLDSLAVATKNPEVKANLMVIGGQNQDIAHYQKKIHDLSIESSVKFIGQRPVSALAYYMQQADFLVSPRTQGTNTPMKLYSYLASTKPVLATDLPTHTQVMNEEIGILAKPTVVDFAKAIAVLAENPKAYQPRAKKAAEYIAKYHSYAVFAEQIQQVYRDVQSN